MLESNPGYRLLKKGNVLKWDDAAGTFFIQFEVENQPVSLPYQEPEETTSFQLKEPSQSGTTLTKARPNQPRFNFEVFARYGARYAVCDVQVPGMLQVAHICGKGEDGSDDPRNGLVLCANHHRAFDEYLFSVDPSSLRIVVPDRVLMRLG